MPELGAFLVVFVILAVVFSVLERRFPALPGQRLLRPGLRTDLTYWLAQPLLFKPVAEVLTAIALVVLAIAAGVHPDNASITEWVHKGHGPLARLPVWAQATLALLIIDLQGYWTHRLFHGRHLWRFHAIHHSATELSWLSAVRVHPVNEIANRALHAVVLAGLGFRIEVLLGVVPLFALYALLLHANVPWSFGPFKYVLASPTFHRFHHSAEEQGLGTNFAGLFPLWDLMFGTFHMPEGQLPTRFGVLPGPEGPLPQTFWKQLLWPFRRAPLPLPATAGLEALLQRLRTRRTWS